MSKLIAAAYDIARRAHAGQTDKAGQNYMGHIERVAASVTASGGSDEAVCAALLHDVMEDTDALPANDLRRIFGDEIAEAVLALTHRDGESYEQFVRRAGENAIARTVKIADLIDNSNLSRLPQITLQDVQRQRKYNDALLYLLSL